MLTPKLKRKVADLHVGQLVLVLVCHAVLAWIFVAGIEEGARLAPTNYPFVPIGYSEPDEALLTDEQLVEKMLSEGRFQFEAEAYVAGRPPAADRLAGLARYLEHYRSWTEGNERRRWDSTFMLLIGFTGTATVLISGLSTLWAWFEARKPE